MNLLLRWASWKIVEIHKCSFSRILNQFFSSSFAHLSCSSFYLMSFINHFLSLSSSSFFLFSSSIFAMRSLSFSYLFLSICSLISFFFFSRSSRYLSSFDTPRFFEVSPTCLLGLLKLLDICSYILIALLVNAEEFSNWEGDSSNTSPFITSQPPSWFVFLISFGIFTWSSYSKFSSLISSSSIFYLLLSSVYYCYFYLNISCSHYFIAFMNFSILYFSSFSLILILSNSYAFAFQI